MSLPGHYVPTIAEWLSGKTILVTGSTGFVGKLLLEKILRCCPNVNKIYLLLRSKKGKTPQERLQDLLKSDLWTYTKCNYDFSKLIPIAADLSVAGMGLSPSDIQLFQDTVHIVYHVAASIRFTEPLIDAVIANLRLTRDVVNLSKGMKNLEIYVQVSTAFVNSDHTHIKEELRAASLDWRKLIELAETGDPLEIDALTELLLGDYPNVYILTKNLAEHVVWEQRFDIPVLIYRPVIVCCLRREPEVGWTDNISGPEIILYSVGKGVIRVLGQDFDACMNVCPGDITINGLLTATWKASCHAKHTGQNPARVVNSNSHLFSLNIAIREGQQIAETNPIPDILWKEHYIEVKNAHMFLVLHLLLNILPAIIIEQMSKLTGRYYPLTRALRKYYVMITVLYSRFASTDFQIDSNNIMRAVESLTPEDKEVYDIRILRPGETEGQFFDAATKRFILLLKDRDLPLERRLRHRRRMVFIDKVFKVMFVFAVAYAISYFYFF